MAYIAMHATMSSSSQKVIHGETISKVNLFPLTSGEKYIGWVKVCEEAIISSCICYNNLLP